MTPRRLSDSLSVAEQVTAEDIATAHAAGFRSIICNRPDGEGDGQPPFAAIQAAAAALSMPAVYQPVISGKVGDEEASAFTREFAALPKPVLAYCRTGTRCTTLWALAEAKAGTPAAVILETAAAAGYDMVATLAAWGARRGRS
jgi:sulfide:quinone oxidoreductase